MAGIDTNTDPSSSSSGSMQNQSGAGIGMHPRLLKACQTANCGVFDYLYDKLVGPEILKDKTPYGNTALHIAVMLGHEAFAKRLLSRELSLLICQNNDGETPLIAALMAGNSSIAKALIDIAAAASSREPPDHDLESAPQNFLCEMVEMVDLCGQNALHYALCSMPDQNLALYILDAVRDHQETAAHLSRQVSNYGESPINIACRRGYLEVVEKLLAITESSDEGPKNTTAMHTAVVARQTGIVNKLYKQRPHLASRVCNGDTPLTLAIVTDNLVMVETFMRHDPGLAYINCVACNDDSNKGDESHGRTLSPFILAAILGRVEIANEIASHCPDSAYYRNGPDRLNALHEAIKEEDHKMVEYLLHTPKFQSLINQADSCGKLPLHYAAEMCNTELLRSLLSRKTPDFTAVTVNNESAFDLAYSRNELISRKWNDTCNFLSRQTCFSTWNLSEHRTKKRINQVQEEQNTMSLMPLDEYAKKASMIAILIITITFVAVFSTVRVPAAAYNTANSLPVSVLATKQVPFEVFLIAYTTALLTSLAVCFSASYIQDEYRVLIARMLLVVAYCATTATFVSGLYLMGAKNLLMWLVLLICIVLIAVILIRFKYYTSGRIWYPRFISWLRRN